MKFKNKVCRVFTFAMVLIMIFPAVCVQGFNFTPTTYDDDGNLCDLDLYSSSVYMMNLDTRETLVDINGEEERVPASLTKIMTAVVLLDEFGGDEKKLKETYVSAGTEAFDELYGTGASTADIQPYEEVSYYDLLASLLIPSACESANIIAINIGGSTIKFCDLMNKKAEELGMKNSHFSNAHGLFAQQNYTSCKDIAILCKYAIEHYSVFRDIVCLPSYQMESTAYHETGSQILNTNLMLNQATDYYYSYAKGIKTGSLDSAGRCLASYASYDGANYLVVTMGAPMEKLAEDIAKGESDPDSIYGGDYVYYNILDHIAIYRWAFSMLVETNFINDSSEIRDVSVLYGKEIDYANLKPANSYTQMWPTNISTDDVERIITVKENIVAPVEVGDVLGEMQLVYKGEVLETIDLVSTTKVERSQLQSEIKIAKSYFKSKVFIITISVLISLFVIYALIHFIRIQRKYMR